MFLYNNKERFRKKSSHIILLFTQICNLLKPTVSGKTFQSTSVSLKLLQSGDIQPNPGPYKPKFPCKYCNKAAKWTKKCLQCNICNCWYYADCLEMPSSLYNIHEENPSMSWTCSMGCGMPQFWGINSSILHSATAVLTLTRSPPRQ